MSDKDPYNPKDAVRRATRSMNSFVRKHAPPSERSLTLSSATMPLPCAVLLLSFTENGPMPDDFLGLPKTSQALKEHVRPDGAVYKGAFQLQGDKDSVVLMYGPKNLTQERAERIASMERLALTRRHASKKLGVFGAQSSPSSHPTAG